MPAATASPSRCLCGGRTPAWPTSGKMSCTSLTTHLATTYGTVVVEHRNVSGMARGRLAKSVYDAGMAGIRRQLRYKHVWYGGELVEAPVHYPSSKRCSACGAVKADLPLWERTYRCEACGMVLNRDLNASHHLAALAAAVAGSGPAT